MPKQAHLQLPERQTSLWCCANTLRDRRQTNNATCRLSSKAFRATNTKRLQRHNKLLCVALISSCDMGPLNFSGRTVRLWGIWLSTAKLFGTLLAQEISKDKKKKINHTYVRTHARTGVWNSPVGHSWVFCFCTVQVLPGRLCAAGTPLLAESASWCPH